MKPELVRRNEIVMLMYQVPGIMLTVRGRATEGGAEGDVIGVLNQHTKRVVHGTVIGSGRVMIGTGARQMAATSTGAQATGAIGSTR
jgi:flagella basal body P-ring formation protein FlgA